MYLCRLCLNESKFCFSLFTDNMHEKIESLTFIKIVQGDNFPQTCCESCMTNLYSAYDFQQCIIQAHKTLLNLSNKQTDTIKIEESDSAGKSEIEDVETLHEIFVENDNEIKIEEKVNESFNNLTNEDSSTDDSEITDVVMIDDKDIFELNFISDDVRNEETSEILSDSDKIESADNSDLETEIFENQSQFLECTECNLKFKSKKSCHQHMAKHRLDSCPFCFILMRRDNLKKHLQTHGETPEICEICGKISKNKESLRGHINYQHKGKAKIKCEYCSKEFKSTPHYNTHVRNVHLGIRNHQCHICGKKFFANHDVTKHINMTHKKARPYICPHCKKGFSSLYARKTHIRQHTLETPYRCEICAAGFRQKVSLISHLKNKHNTEKRVIKTEVECNDDS